MADDRLNFDGSCSPNPGGTLRYGWAISWADGRNSEGGAEQGPNSANTVNIAEYAGVEAGLRAYLEAGGRGPLLVQGDSQLIIRQLRGEYRVRDHLVAPNQRVKALAAQVPGGVTYEWVRREQNSAADQLTHRPDERIPPLGQRTILVEPAMATTTASVRQQVVRVNMLPSPGFGDLARLKVGGTDALSKLRLGQLIERVSPARRVQVEDVLTAAFPNDDTSQAAALRWALRGLALELAVRKVEVDAEIRLRSGK